MSRRRTRFIVVVTALAALSLGCSEKTPDEAPAGEASDDAKAPATAPPKGIAMGSAEPAMLDQVGKVDLPPAEAPSSWEGGWQLKPDAAWKYAYTQNIKAQMDDEAAGQMKQGMEVTGTLVVTATSESAADVELTEAKSVATMVLPGQPERKMEQPIPPKKYAGLLTTTTAPVQPEDPLVYAILAVPSSATEVGKPVSQQLSMPIDTPEGEIKAEGTATWKLEGFVKCGEHTCAHYTHDVDISKLTPPAGAKGTYGARARAIGWTLFDVDDGALYRHKSATHLALKGEVPAAAMPASPHGAASQPAADAEPQRMDMTQEHFHEVVRQ